MEGEDHKKLKSRAAAKMEKKGYDVEKEKKLDNGLIVDVYANDAEETVIIEVGSLNGEGRFEELRKCADRVVHMTQLGKDRIRRYDDSINMDLGVEYKSKLREIAEARHRRMTGQIRTWIDRYYPKVVDE